MSAAKSPSVNSSTTRSERSAGCQSSSAAVEAVLVVERLVDVLEGGRDVAVPRERIARELLGRRYLPQLLDEALGVRRQVHLPQRGGAEDEQGNPNRPA